ncbi:hypothetical protein TRSC58_04700 [Trypanosoma rangeli SC58]|uniref:Uncharacterized protein n=1 Tax=Trypanosoma rangeli SC58 TaxID=429131 RepID=A0A061IWW0_TRYRA|nr:hypothetical protein TRSC58_04700 [Trypanosoma rangeli SC58]
MMLVLFVLLLLSAVRTDGVNVTSCSHCTTNAAQVWCPDDMSCHPADNCSCGTDCFSLVDCFVQGTTCTRCVSSGGTFCTRPANGHRPCFFTVGGAARRPATASHESQCSEVCLESGRCLSRLDECPRKPVDPVLFSWFVVNVAVAVAITVFVGIVVHVGVARAKQEVSA